MTNSTSWDLSFLEPSEEAFLADLEQFKSLGAKLGSYQGKLGQPEQLHEALELEKELEKLINRVYSFAAHRSDLNKKDVNNASDLAKVQIALQQFFAQVSYIDPELIALGEDYLNDYLKAHPEHAEFAFSFKKLFRGQKFVLSADKEALLANYSPLLNEGGTLYSQLSVGDYQPKEITLSDGSKVTVSQANWTDLVAKAKKAEDRQAIFEALYSYYETHKNVYGEIYNLTVQSQLSQMKARGYSSILQTHLYENAIPEEVFHNLVRVASTHAEPLHRYIELRRKALGLEHHRSYDRFLQLAESEARYTYEEAKDIFFDSLKEFPEDYQQKAREVLKPGYVDVYPADGKRTGAYSSGGQGIHPIILLNFIGNLEDVFTLAHESGHSMHTLYADESQPLMTSNYTIFVAEIASTFNEHNLLDYFLKKKGLSKNDKIALLQKAIDQIVSTFYRQTLFGHYEYDISLLAEQGKPINFQVCSEEMKKLYQQYYGIDIGEEKVKEFVWAYIPHLFYTPFYVYQYATSFTSSMLIYQRVKDKEPGAFEKHIGLLRSGGSDYPVELVKKAGVDLTTDEPYLAVVRRMEELVDQLEALLSE